MKILSFLRQFKKSLSFYRPLIEVLIYKENILHNLKEFQRKYPNQKIAPVLKSNAYGHGLVQVAEILDKENIVFLVVDSMFEAMTLRNEGIKSKLLIIGYTKPHDINRNRYKNIAFTITNFWQLSEISKKLRTKQSFHLKIDTGMHRQGILPKEIKNSIARIRSNKNINLEGICSHFASADSHDNLYSKKQICEWDSVVKIFKVEFPEIKYFHLAATAGSFYEHNSTNTVRLGLGLYGMDPHPARKINIKPALELRTIISGIKTVQKGEYVGYGLTFKSKEKMRVATVPAGYFEGVDRRLSNCGFYKIGESFCPILGRVSMNISVVDISKAKGLRVGNPVVLISKLKKDRNSAWQIAKLCGTIPYEILVHIPQHLRRVIV